MARLIHARNLQPRNDPTRRIAESYTHKLAVAIFNAFRSLRDQTSGSYAQLRKADPPTPGAAGNVTAQFLSDTALTAAIEHALDGLNGAALEAAKDAIERAARNAGVDATQESVLSVALHAALDAYRADLVRQVSQDTIDAITTVVQQGLDAGERFDEIARDVRPLIGLTTQQAAAVRSYADGLESLDPAVLARAWHDPRLSPTIQDAIDGNQFLDPDYIDSAVQRYADRALAGRATAIARTETLRAANLGAREGTRGFLESRGMDQTAMRRYWQTALDELVCPVCMGIPDLNPEGVGIDEPFAVDNDEGEIDIPPVHPNCRCTVVMRIDAAALAAWQAEQDAKEAA